MAMRSGPRQVAVIERVAVKRGSTVHPKISQCTKCTVYFNHTPCVYSLQSPTASSAVESRSSSEEPQGQLMRAVYDYSGSQEDDITFNEGDLIRIMYKGEDGWAEGLLGEKYGYVPIAYFEPVTQ